MRHVFPTGEIAHKWAHATQADARNPQGNLYFRGATLYSYRDSYPIAKIFKKKNVVLALHVSNTYSATTAGHCSSARGATRHLPSITVPDVVPDDKWRKPAERHAQNIKYLTDAAAEHLAKAGRAMQADTVAWRRREAAARLQDARGYSVFFGIRRKVPAFPEIAWNAAAARAERIENPDPASADRRERASARRQEATRDKREYLAEMLRSRRAAAAAAEFYPRMAERTDWRLDSAYGTAHHSYYMREPVMLRVNADQIETSAGARIPLAHAPRVWRLVQSVISAGRPYVRNGHTEHAGEYAIDKVDVDGTLHAGCHVIPHSELRAMARALKL